MKYLGVKLYTKLMFLDQISTVVVRGERIKTSISRLMNNIGDSVASKRRMVISVQLLLCWFASLLYPTKFLAHINRLCESDRVRIRKMSVLLNKDKMDTI